MVALRVNRAELVEAHWVGEVIVLVDGVVLDFPSNVNWSCLFRTDEEDFESQSESQIESVTEPEPPSHTVCIDLWISSQNNTNVNSDYRIWNEVDPRYLY